MSEERPKSQFMLPDPPEGKATATKPVSPIALPKSLLEAHSLQQTDTDHQGRRKAGAQPTPTPQSLRGPGSFLQVLKSPLNSAAGEGKKGRVLGAGLEGHTLFSLPFHLANSVMWSTTLREPGKCTQVILQEEEDGVLATNSCLCHIIR